MTISHIFSKYKETPKETKNANIALSQFIKVPSLSFFYVAYRSLYCVSLPHIASSVLMFTNLDILFSTLLYRWFISII